MEETSTRPMNYSPQATFITTRPAPESAPEPDGMKQLISTYQTAFPDAIEGRGNARFGRHCDHSLDGPRHNRGDLSGIAPTGRSVHGARHLDASHRRRQNRRELECVDTLGMMQQVGAVPALAPAAASTAR